MCIPQRKILETDPLTSWSLLRLNVRRSIVLEYMAKSASQRRRTTLSLQLLVVGLSTLGLGLQRSKGQMLTKVMISEVIHITYTHTWRNSGTASVPQAAAASQGWGQMFSSWIFPSAPSIDKGPQATSQQTSRKGNGTLSSCFAYLKLFVTKDAGPKPQSPKSSKGKKIPIKRH